ncbi:uncharacterized protein LOC131955030 [Physella acuta]|uniref:uncharacterized protein LOC131955030 n=1 Tax=Physella acuta TaxID=109671 RepID=UPI0027DBAE67|nr:uncharacterized protein LOC131955030 [Physella acuta]
MDSINSLTRMVFLVVFVISAHFSHLTHGTNDVLLSKIREKRQATLPNPGGATTPTTTRSTATARTTDAGIGELIAGLNVSHDARLLRYTPATPHPENINCYVEVPVVQRVGGRCVSLGSAGNQMGCQAGIYLAFTPECQQSEETEPTPSRRRNPQNINRRRNQRGRSRNGGQ